ncbi:MAG: phosphate acyltransferase PlsX, partial [Armatimonadota bacterium]
ELPSSVKVVEARDVIAMDDKPAEAVRKKRDASLVVCARMVKEGAADALVTAGNTGAATAVSLLTWGRVKGVERPAIATFMPYRSGTFLFMDCGASPDVEPAQIVEFALMGRAWVQKVAGRQNPKVQLLNIGEEPGKGNAFTKEAFELLSPFEWFAGNLEGKDMFKQPADVVVCEGFVGNMVLKSCEGVGEFILDEIRAAVPKGPGKLLFWPLKKALAPLRQKVDYAEYGGSPLLGVNGICIIGHGRSNAKAVRNAILNAVKAVEGGLVSSIAESVRAVRQD